MSLACDRCGATATFEGRTVYRMAGGVVVCTRCRQRDDGQP